MKKKKIITLGIGIVCFAALLSSYFLLKDHNEEQEKAEEEAAEEETTEIFSVETDDIASISFYADGKQVTFDKDEDAWTKNGEEAFPVNTTKMTDMENELASVEAERTLENVEDLSEYGLDEPQNEVTVKTTEDETKVLHIGDENQNTNQYYVYLDDAKDTVYTVSSSIVDAFSGSLYDFATGESFPAIDSSMIKEIEVSKNEDPYVLIRDDSVSSGWKTGTSEDTLENADSAQATTLTGGIAGLTYGDFVNYNCTDLSEYGLDKPVGTIAVTYEEEIEEEDSDAEEADTEEADTEDTDTEDTDTEDTDTEEADTKEADIEEEQEENTDSEEADSENTDSEEEVKTEIKTLKLLVGDAAEDDSYYVTVEGTNQVYTMTSDSLDQFLDTTINDLWDLTVNYLALSDMEEMQVTMDGETKTLTVTRETTTDEDGEEEETSTYYVDGEEADENDFTSFYGKVVNISAQKRTTEEYEPSGEAEFSVYLKDGSGNESEVKYYSYDTNFYAGVRENGNVYLVNKMTIKETMDLYKELIGAKETEEEGQETEAK